MAGVGVGEARPVSVRTRLGIGRQRQILLLVGFVVVVFVLWEGAKFLGGVPWRDLGTGPQGPVIHTPPFRWPLANDLNLPHIWNILLVLFDPFRRGWDGPVLQRGVGAALYTWREAGIGFVVGAFVGLALATAFVHSRLFERAFVPYVIASQTIPIIALAPMIVFAFGQSVISVVIIATYLTFFPVTIAMIRGLRSYDPRGPAAGAAPSLPFSRVPMAMIGGLRSYAPRAMELMRSFAASPWQAYVKLRRTASAPWP